MFLRKNSTKKGFDVRSGKRTSKSSTSKPQSNNKRKTGIEVLRNDN